MSDPAGREAALVACVRCTHDLSRHDTNGHGLCSSCDCCAPEPAALVACQRHGCGHPIGAHVGSEWGEKCSACPCPDYWSGKYPLHDCDEDGACAPWCRTCGSEPAVAAGTLTTAQRLGIDDRQEDPVLAAYGIGYAQGQRDAREACEQRG